MIRRRDRVSGVTAGQCFPRPSLCAIGQPEKIKECKRKVKGKRRVRTRNRVVDCADSRDCSAGFGCHATTSTKRDGSVKKVCCTKNSMYRMCVLYTWVICVCVCVLFMYVLFCACVLYVCVYVRVCLCMCNDNPIYNIHWLIVSQPKKGTATYIIHSKHSMYLYLDLYGSADCDNIQDPIAAIPYITPDLTMGLIHVCWILQVIAMWHQRSPDDPRPAPSCITSM